MRALPGVSIPQDRTAVHLGAKIRAAREARGLLLKDLAAGCGVTASLLSQVERGHANPSLNTLRAIAQRLEVPLVTFFEEPSSGGRVLRRHERRRLTLPAGSATYEMISPRTSRHIEVGIMELHPGAWSIDRPMAHRGEEVSFVLRGSVDLEMDGTVHPMEEGDSVVIPEGSRHRWLNTGETTAKVVFAISPPGF